MCAAFDLDTSRTRRRVRQRILAARLRNGYKASLGTDGSSFKDDAPMLPSDLDSLTLVQRLIVEQAFVLAKELESAADSGPDGQVIDRCESFLLGNGRDFLRRVLESTLQSRAELLEKN
jgi:phosphatidylserine/phosphatidylglycerophosphate/cardiolipin synthase-like enzyme